MATDFPCAKVQRVLMEATGNAAEATMPLAMVGFILEGHTHSIGHSAGTEWLMVKYHEISGWHIWDIEQMNYMKHTHTNSGF